MANEDSYLKRRGPSQESHNTAHFSKYRSTIYKMLETIIRIIDYLKYNSFLVEALD
jgi:hypothetical protein